MPVGPTVHALPFETLSNIFVQYANDEPKDLPPTLRSPSVIVGRVCSRWRRISAATPQLWSEIYIECCNDLDRFDLRCARTYLSNPDSAIPLSLHLHCIRNDKKFSFGEENRDAFKRLIIPYTKRWAALDVQMFIMPYGVKGLIDTMQGFTSLTNFHVSLPDEGVVKMPDNYVANEWKDVLPLSESTITLPSLSHLSFDARSFHDPCSTLTPVMDSLKLPALTKLTLLLKDVFLRLEPPFYDHVWEVVGDLLARSNAPLKYIHTTSESNPLYSSALSQVIKHAPLLEIATHLYLDTEELQLLSLTIPGCRVDSTVTFQHAPNLKEVSISLTDPEDADDLPDMDFMIPMLSSRWSGGQGPLRKLHIDDSISPILLNRIRTELQGMEVIMTRRGDDGCRNVMYSYPLNGGV